MVLMVVDAAAETNGLPPNVAAWVPGTKLSAQKTITLKTKSTSPSLLEKLQSLKGVLSVRDKKTFIELQTSSDSSINEQVVQAVVSGNFGLLEIKEEGLDLEKVFIRLTGGKEESKS